MIGVVEITRRLCVAAAGIDRPVDAAEVKYSLNLHTVIPQPGQSLDPMPVAHRVGAETAGKCQLIPYFIASRIRWCTPA